MGLRCLIGHDYGEPQTDRRREERGDDVIVTVREYRECARCGQERVISENTEVTAGPSREPTEEPATEPSSVEPPAGPSGGEFDDLSAEEDDGVILDDDGEPERGRGEWPAADVGEPPEPDEEPDAWPEVDDGDDAGGAEAEPDGEPQPWPEAEGDDEGFAAEAGDGGPADEVEFRGGLTPERTPGDPASDVDEGVETVEAAPGEAATDGFAAAGSDAGDPTPAGIRSAESGPSPAARERPTDEETEFVCPECDHTVPSDHSSLRPGDICPECHRGYLAERALE